MSEQVRSVVLGTAGLALAAGVALLLTLRRGPIAGDEARLQAAVRLAAVAIVVQAAHFAEELGTGFFARFPALLGLAPWSRAFFVSFNVLWLGVWAASVRGLQRRQRAALFPLWFLALGCVANGLAHPVLAASAAAYFPGLVTAPLAGVVGALLVRRLLLVTAVEEDLPSAVDSAHRRSTRGRQADSGRAKWEERA